MQRVGRAADGAAAGDRVDILEEAQVLHAGPHARVVPDRQRGEPQKAAAASSRWHAACVCKRMTLPAATLPVIDLSDLDGSAAASAALARTLDQACRDIGFIVVKGHRVAPEVLRAAF
ncbi:MAG: hypothetical protein EOO24_62585, partial [Comamonadaceae bacterium]